MFQSRNRASRPSDIAGLNARTLVWEFQSRNRASRPSDYRSFASGSYPDARRFNPAIGLPGLLTPDRLGPGLLLYSFNPAIGLPGLLTMSKARLRQSVPRFNPAIGLPGLLTDVVFQR